MKHLFFVVSFLLFVASTFAQPYQKLSEQIISYLETLNLSNAETFRDIHNTLISLERGDNMNKVYSDGQKYSRMGIAAGDYILGWCHALGEGGAQFDLSKTFQYMSKAASASKPYPIAYAHLGDHYYGGDGVAQDYSLAKYWYEKGASVIVEPNKKAACLRMLGQIFENGEGVSHDYSKAMYYYQEVVKLGKTNDTHIACIKLAYMYGLGKGVETDIQKAYYWEEKAASYGNREALFSVGWALYSGKFRGLLDIPINEERGLSFIKESARLGNVNAMKCLNELGL